MPLNPAGVGLRLIQAEIGSIVPLGRGFLLIISRHFVPGYYRAVPPGQKATISLSLRDKRSWAVEPREPSPSNGHQPKC